MDLAIVSIIVDNPTVKNQNATSQIAGLPR
jgi:hypothetical protein